MPERSADGIRADANNIVLVHTVDGDEMRTFVMTTNGQVYVTEIILREGAAVSRNTNLSLLIEGGMTVEQYADKLFRDFPDPRSLPDETPPSEASTPAPGDHTD